SEADDTKASAASRCVCLPQLRHGGAITDIGQYRQTAKTDNNLTQKFKSFASRISVLHRQAGDVAPRTLQARDKAGAKWVICRREHDRDDRWGLLCPGARSTRRQA